MNDKAAQDKAAADEKPTNDNVVQDDVTTKKAALDKATSTLNTWVVEGRKLDQATNEAYAEKLKTNENDLHYEWKLYNHYQAWTRQQQIRPVIKAARAAVKKAQDDYDAATKSQASR